MILSEDIKERIRLKSGLQLQQSYDCKVLMQEIERVTNQHVGISTLKRLFGFFPDDRMPRVSTLDVIAQYLGFSNWEQMIADGEMSNSKFENGPDHVDLSQLEVNDRIRFTYQPGREVVIRTLGAGKFVVEKSTNSKLAVGDLLEIEHLVCKFPLYISKVTRAGEVLGSFTAGRRGGLTSIELLDDGK